MFLIIEFIEIIITVSNCFNPLNQVYVFNKKLYDDNGVERPFSFNPLNQVYVFNYYRKKYDIHNQFNSVLIP